MVVDINKIALQAMEKNGVNKGIAFYISHEYANILHLMVSFFDFFCSIFILSNETVNIWSHLLGFLLFFSLGVNDLLSVLPASGANREDYVIYAIGLFCFQVQCMYACDLKSWFSCCPLPSLLLQNICELHLRRHLSC